MYKDLKGNVSSNCLINADDPVPITVNANSQMCCQAIDRNEINREYCSSIIIDI
jgi:hypothetical protein